jgi:hypothetical protein
MSFDWPAMVRTLNGSVAGWIVGGSLGAMNWIWVPAS